MTGTDSPQQTWYETFDAASPLERHRLLTQTLASGLPELDQEVLEYAVASVTQLLMRHNQLEALAGLEQALTGKYQAIRARLLPMLNLSALDRMLFDGAFEQIPAVLEGFTAFEDELPEELWMTLLDRLCFYGCQAPADELARELLSRYGAQPEAGEMLLISRLREQLLLSAIQTYWQSAGDPADRARFDEVIALMQETDAELLAIMYQQRDEAAEAQLAIVLDKFQQGATFSAVHNAQMAFGRWALAEHGLNLFTSAEIMSHAVMLWRSHEKSPESLSLETLVDVDEAQLDAYFQALDEDSELGLDGLVVFCWGLPLVHDWLLKLGLLTQASRDRSRAVLTEMQAAVIEAAGPGLWTYGFVRRWPGVGPEDAALFEASRRASVPLSDDPADSQLFDEADEQVSEAELMAFMTEQLAGLDPQQREQVLNMLANEFGPEAGQALGEELGRIVQPGSGLILPASYRPGDS